MMTFTAVILFCLILMWIYICIDFAKYAWHYNQIEDNQYKLSKFHLTIGGLVVPMCNAMTTLIMAFAHFKLGIRDFISGWVIIQLCGLTYPVWLYAIAKFKLIPAK